MRPFELFQGDRVIEKGERSVTAVDDAGPGCKWVAMCVDAPGEGGRDASRAVADAMRPVASAWTSSYALGVHKWLVR